MTTWNLRCELRGAPRSCRGALPPPAWAGCRALCDRLRSPSVPAPLAASSRSAATAASTSATDSAVSAPGSWVPAVSPRRTGHVAQFPSARPIASAGAPSIRSAMPRRHVGWRARRAPTHRSWVPRRSAPEPLRTSLTRVVIAATSPSEVSGAGHSAHVAAEEQVGAVDRGAVLLSPGRLQRVAVHLAWSGRSRGPGLRPTGAAFHTLARRVAARPAAGPARQASVAATATAAPSITATSAASHFRAGSGSGSPPAPGVGGDPVPPPDRVGQPDSCGRASRSASAIDGRQPPPPMNRDPSPYAPYWPISRLSAGGRRAGNTCLIAGPGSPSRGAPLSRTTWACGSGHGVLGVAEVTGNLLEPILRAAIAGNCGGHVGRRREQHAYHVRRW